ncbi:isochorismate synthase [Ascidiimonas sp. W6]|uniref:isochorismate synthase n=1 Tax=Ascidiimonas meishanensis TaxID=3128903 RepID=UPI0030EEF800
MSNLNKSEIYKRAQISLNEEKPFVIYRKVNDSFLNAFFQQDNKTYPYEHSVSSGFIMAPFNSNDSAYIIPTEKADFLSVKLAKASNHVFIHAEDNYEALDPLAAANFKNLVEKSILEIQSKALLKVVLSRKEVIPFQASFIETFQILEQLYPSAFCYLWYHPATGCWTGATPETLLSFNGKKYKTVSLAGTRKFISATPKRWGKKELDEQAIVTDTIVNTLRLYTESLEIEGPKTIKAGILEHLKTEITGSVKEENLIKLLQSLHPTPAVCGTPRDKAKDFILANEDYKREFYTGFLGIINVKSKPSSTALTELFVNLRCMKLEKTKASIYVGGGITADSNPRDEWEETVNKSKTMKKVLLNIPKEGFRKH